MLADYACTETVYDARVLRRDRRPTVQQLDFSTFGVKTFTVTATDANGGVTTKTVNYEVGGNVPPVVDAGTDQTVNGGEHVTLHGSAEDPDTGQILSYQWSQTGGPPVDAERRDDAERPVRTEPAVRRTARWPVRPHLPAPRRRRLRHR